jgi:hypothetical protein
MYNFYQIYDNSDYNNSMLYSFGFNGYFNMISHVGTMCDSKLVETTFTKNRKYRAKLYFFERSQNFLKNVESVCKNNDIVFS